MVADRAVCRLKCSVVMIVTAACGFWGSDSYGCFMAPILLADAGRDDSSRLSRTSTRAVRTATSTPGQLTLVDRAQLTFSPTDLLAIGVDDAKRPGSANKAPNGI